VHSPTFFNELSALKEDKSQSLVIAYGAGHWVTQKGSIPAPSKRAHKECALPFEVIPVYKFRTTYLHHELGCTIQRGEIEKSKRSADRAGNSTRDTSSRTSSISQFKQRQETNGIRESRLETTYNIRRCAVLEGRSPELTRTNFVEQPPGLNLY